jgi:hypothetical protein
LEHQFGVFAGDEGEQASDRGQTSIARRRGASALLLDVIQEAEHDFLGDVFDVQFVDRLFERIRYVAKQQLDGIAVGPHRILRMAFLHRHVVTEESLQQRSHSVSHDGFPFEAT